MTYRLCDSLLDKIKGPVICSLNGEEIEYQNVQELTSRPFDKKYVVSEIYPRGERIVVKLAESGIIPNDLTTEWAQKQRQETGRELTFF